MANTLNLLTSQRCFEGEQRRYQHRAASTSCDMVFSVFLPKQALAGDKLPVLYWLSGMTCTDEKFSLQSFAQAYAARYGLILVIPDTSPRGDQVPDDEAPDLGQGSGFYVNATQAPWKEHYRMYDYIVAELPALISQSFPVTDKWAIAGHSMGGFGALMIGLRNADRFCSISAIAPVAAILETPISHKSLTAYLGADKEAWKAYDTISLVQTASSKIPIMIDQGTDDEFYPENMRPEAFVEAAKDAGFDCQFRLQEGYDHSYFHVKTFLADHFAFHARHLGVV